MPLQRDFMMRMIERLSAAFFRIVAGRTVESPEETKGEIEDLLAEVLGTEPTFVLGQGPAAIDTVEPALAAEVGRLLLLHADLSDELEQSTAARRARVMGYQGLLRAMQRPEPDYAKMAEGELREHLSKLPMVIERSLLAEGCLAAHVVAIEREAWDDAEDWLFWALDLQASDGVLAAGDAFYDALDAKTDAEVEAGGLSRAEIEESRQALAEYRA